MEEEQRQNRVLDEYTSWALSKANPDTDIIYCALKLAGEAGEFSDAIGKWYAQQHTLDGEHLKEELGDICWYIAIAASLLGEDLYSILERNRDKLNKRYPNGFSAERSRQR